MIKGLNFQSLPVTDQDRALTFYRDKMGFTVQTDAPYGDGWRWIFIQIPGAETMIHFAKPAEISFNGIPALALTCDDVDAETGRLQALDVTVTDGPADAPWHASVRYSLIKDSEENLLLLQSSSLEGA
jgi:catechol 2,3-dioxygenase-like lactoylglutathione lyase family enzyme